MDIKLTSDQQAILYALVKGVKKEKLPVQTFGGYAGTGKTVLVSYLHQILDDYAVCAFTGKAANVLRNKNISTASTIHSLIYKPFTESDGSVTFMINDDFAHKGIIVDEASMVTQELHEDMSSFGVPIIYVGDHGQLPPVGNDFNIMENPMYRLEEIHRNAGTIARFCEWIRLGRTPRSFPIPMNADNKVKFIQRWQITPQMVAESDQTICAFNQTRVEMNAKVREYLGLKDVLHKGEKIMCLRNNRKFGIFNGMQGTVTHLYTKKRRKFLCMSSNGVEYYDIPYDPDQFGKASLETPYSKEGPVPFDYAPVITAHKSQGDEFGKGIVIEQICKKWPHNRWGYTAGSRFKEELIWSLA